MKKIITLVMALSFVVLYSCKSDPQQNVLSEGEVMQDSLGLNEEANGINTIVDSVKKDFDEAGESIKSTIEDIENENTQLQENIEKSKRETKSK